MPCAGIDSPEVSVSSSPLRPPARGSVKEAKLVYHESCKGIGPFKVSASSSPFRPACACEGEDRKQNWLVTYLAKESILLKCLRAPPLTGPPARVRGKTESKIGVSHAVIFFSYIMPRTISAMLACNTPCAAV